ncbi:MAG: phage tail protein [Bryobacteraceae bacterium]
MDPYRNFRFRVKFVPTTGQPAYVAGVSKVTGLTRSTEVVPWRDGGYLGAALRMPGQTQFTAITMEKGVTHDPAFAQWANKVWDYKNSLAAPAGTGTVASLQDFRQNLSIELWNEAGYKVIAYNVYRCWVSEYTAMPDLDANGNAVAIQTIKIENEGWDVDTTVNESASFETSFTDPSAL